MTDEQPAQRRSGHSSAGGGAVGFAGCASTAPAPSRDLAESPPASVPAATGTAVPASGEVGGDPAVVAVVSDGRGTVTVEAVDPASGRSDILHRVRDGTDVIYGDWFDLQMDLPAGFVHVIEMTPVERHLLISVAEQRAFEIPAPAFSHPPGFGTQG